MSGGASVFRFEIEAAHGRARAARFTTPHGIVESPAFMPVGTIATVKGLDPEDLTTMGASMILANAYHLHLRPGAEVVRHFGGLHGFMQWQGPILTDSGGFQVFSLAGLRTVEEAGVEFRSHLDGSRHRFTPESVMGLERLLGADVIMQFDHVIPGQSDAPSARDASERSVRWLVRCAREFDRIEREGLPPDTAGAPRVPPAQALFPIVQGGIHPELRQEAARHIGELGDWRGYGIGGLSVGESKPDMYAMLDILDGSIPRERPRYLMGVGFPEDLVEGVRRGVDLFDCVAPTRMGRNGAAFTGDGRLNIKRAEYRLDERPLDPDCQCAACRRFSRGYIRHLFIADELLGLRLLSLHNVHFLIALMRRARAAIVADEFAAWSDEWLRRYHGGRARTAPTLRPTPSA